MKQLLKTQLMFSTATKEGKGNIRHVKLATQSQKNIIRLCIFGENLNGFPNHLNLATHFWSTSWWQLEELQLKALLFVPGVNHLGKSKRRSLIMVFLLLAQKDNDLIISPTQ